MKISFLFISILCSVLSSTCSSNKSLETSNKEQIKPIALKKIQVNDTAYFASGCFWCVEAIFETTRGVGDVISGYCGGKTLNPSYEEVCSGNTGHAEAVMIPFDSTKITYSELLTVFFGSHDASTLNEQGNDRGTQYRSLIMAKNNAQKGLAETAIQSKKASGEVITTQLISLQKYYNAEEYHQNYERLNPDQPYVRAVSIPRVNKYKKEFPTYLK